MFAVATVVTALDEPTEARRHGGQAQHQAHLQNKPSRPQTTVEHHLLREHANQGTTLANGCVRAALDED